jgi:phosphopantetheinyl transferase (holo-ACP synthase)
MPKTSSPWTLQDQLDLNGKRGFVRRMIAFDKYVAHRFAAKEAADRATQRHADKMKERQ